MVELDLLEELLVEDQVPMTTGLHLLKHHMSHQSHRIVSKLTNQIYY